MGETASFYSGAALILALLFLTKWLLRIMKTTRLNLPPSGPLTLPIIGHLHLLKLPLHHSLANISSRYGPILLLHFGAQPILLVTSADIVEECFTTTDLVFANRPNFESGKYLTYNYTTLGSAPYGAHWRNLRRLTTMELFSPGSLATLSYIRSDNVHDLVGKLFRTPAAVNGGFRRVELKPNFWELMVNIMMQQIDGKKYYGESATTSQEEGERLRRIVDEVFRLGELGSPDNFLPFLRRLGYKGHTKQLAALQEEMDELFQQMVDQRRRQRKERAGDQERKTVIDVMLALQETDPDNYSDIVIKGVILIILQAGSDTSASVMEWAISLLLNNPAVLKKLSFEIETLVGQERLMVDSDLANLPYLNNVIKETLRMFPIASLLPPHRSTSDCKIRGYDIPGGTFLIVNVFSINRDPNVWTEPSKFKPERFEVGEGEGYKFVPFGSGRRRCPAEILATRVMGLALGTLIQCFEWERVGEELVDLTSAGIVSVSKAVPLQALCKPRGNMINILSQL